MSAASWYHDFRDFKFLHVKPHGVILSVFWGASLWPSAIRDAFVELFAVANTLDISFWMGTALFNERRYTKLKDLR